MCSVAPQTLDLDSFSVGVLQESLNVLSKKLGSDILSEKSDSFSVGGEAKQVDADSKSDRSVPIFMERRLWLKIGALIRANVVKEGGQAVEP